MVSNTFFIPIGMLIILLSIWHIKMTGEHGKILTVVAVLTLVVGIVGLYISEQSGFVLEVSPNPEIHVCFENGSLIFDQWTEIAPGVHEQYPKSIIYRNGGLEFIQNVSIINEKGPWWTLGYVIKPYKGQVTLITQNAPPGVEVTFTNQSFSAEIQDNSDTVGIPPFKSKMILRLSRGTQLPRGPHYITIKGIGYDGMERTFTCVLKVGECSRQFRVVSFGNFTASSQ